MSSWTQNPEHCKITSGIQTTFFFCVYHCLRSIQALSVFIVSYIIWHCGRRNRSSDTYSVLMLHNRSGLSTDFVNSRIVSRVKSLTTHVINFLLFHVYKRKTRIYITRWKTEIDSFHFYLQHEIIIQEYHRIRMDNKVVVININQLFLQTQYII